MASNVSRLPIKKRAPKVDELASDVATKYTSGRALKSAFHDLWWTCHAMYEGRQYSQFRGGIAIETKAPSYRQRLVENRIAPLIDTAVNKLVSSRPVAIVRPRGVDMDRLQKAKAAEHLLDYLDRKEDTDSTRAAAAFWQAVTGNGFLRPYWDPDAGDIYELEDGQRIITGAVKYEEISPFDVYPDPGATSMRNARWVIVVHYLTAEEVEGRWPKEYAKVRDTIERAPAGSGYDDEDTWRRDMSGLTGADLNTVNRVRVLEYQERPCRKYPEGRSAFVCEGVVLEEDEEGLPNRDFSIAHLTYRQIGGRFWAGGIVELVLDLQRELNRTISQTSEIRNLHLHPQWTAAAGSIPGNVIQARPDNIIFWKHQYGARPERIDPPALPPSLFQMAQDLRQAMEEVSGIHGVSQGRSESGVISGRAMQTLADQDSQKLGRASASMERAVAHCASHALWLIKNHMTAPIALTILGPNSRAEVIELYSSNIDSTDVEVFAGSGMAKHPSLEAEKATQMFQLGGFEDTEPAAKYREAMGFLGMRGIEDDDSEEALYAEDENAMLQDDMQAATVDVQWLDNDPIHMRRHYRLRNSTKFRRLPPHVQKRIREHMAMHMYSATQKRAAEEAGGQPVWMAELGMEMPAPQPQPGMPMQPGAEESAEEMPGVSSGGTPEMNGAYDPAASPMGPGVNTPEESTGVMQ